MDITDNDSQANNAKTCSIETASNHSAQEEVPKILNNAEQSLDVAPIANTADVKTSAAPVVVKIMSPSTQDNQEQNDSVAENHKLEAEKDETPKKTRRWKKPKDEVTFRTHLTTLAHISVVVFVYLVLKLAFRGDFVFFTWHPILMAVGWMLLMTEGFYAINKNNTYWRLKTKGGFRIKVHVAILSIGYILSIAGVIIVYINKENKSKPHFATWHALFGLIGLLCTLPPIVNGFLLWYSKELAVPNPRLVKFIHVSSGTLAFTFGALALVLSVYTKWFGKKSEHSDYMFYLGLVSVTYPLFWAVYGPSVKLVRVIRDYFSEDKND